MKRTLVIVISMFLLLFVYGEAKCEYLVDTGYNGEGSFGPPMTPLINGIGAEFNVTEEFTITDIELLVGNQQDGWIDAYIYTDSGVPGLPISGLYERATMLDDPNAPIEWQHVGGLEWTLQPGNYWIVFYASSGDPVQKGAINPLGSEVFGMGGSWAAYSAADYCITIQGYPGVPENQPPISDAGPDQVVFEEVTLDGSGSSDTDVIILSFGWFLQHREDSAYDRTAEGVNPTILDLWKGFYDVTLTVTDDGLIGTDTMLLAVAGPYVCTASTMHIQSILPGIAPATKNLKFGQVEITIYDDCGNPVSGANVTGTFTGDYNETHTGATGSDGTAIITTSEFAKKPSYKFCVDDVTHGTLTYDSNDNVVEVCKSK